MISLEDCDMYVENFETFVKTIRSKADTLPNLEENSRLFHTSPLTLLELASMKIALYVWLEKYRKYGRIENRNGNTPRLNISHLQRDELQLHFAYKIPQKIKAMIDHWMDPVTRELQWWYTTSRNAFKSSSDYFGNRFHLVVLGGNGYVHVRDTIENFFRDDSLKNVRKFGIACVHCVEEKIDFYWPLVKDSVFLRAFLSDNFMLDYWIDKKATTKPMFVINKPRSIVEMIRKCCELHLRLAAEYFLGLLIHDEEFNITDLWFDWYLFPSIDATLQRSFLGEYHVNVFQAFFEDSELIKYAVQAWNYIKDAITIEIVYIEIIIHCVRLKNYARFEISHKCMMDKVLAEIWYNLPIDWRHRMLKFLFPDILKELLNHKVNPVNRSVNFGRDISFLLAMLSDADVNLRKGFWIENWSKWIVDVPPAQFEELMVLGLEEPEDVDNFKRTLPSTEIFRNYCDALISKKYLVKLNEFLHGLYSNQDQVIDIKMHLLAKVSIFTAPQRAAWRECDRYINRMFPTRALADDFKYRMILSDRLWQILCAKIDRNYFDDVKNIVSYFVPLLKRQEISLKLLEAFRDRLTNGKLHPFSESAWDSFLNQCGFDCNVLQPVNEFKKPLPINLIFDTAFSNLVTGEITANSLKSFLVWYFNSESECDNFKRERIQCYEEMREENVERIFGKDKKSVVDLMKASLY